MTLILDAKTERERAYAEQIALRPKYNEPTKWLPRGRGPQRPGQLQAIVSGSIHQRFIDDCRARGVAPYDTICIVPPGHRQKILPTGIPGSERFGSEPLSIGQIVRCIVAPSWFTTDIGIIQKIHEQHQIAYVGFPTRDGETIERHAIPLAVLDRAWPSEIAALHRRWDTDIRL